MDRGEFFGRESIEARNGGERLYLRVRPAEALEERAVLLEDGTLRARRAAVCIRDPEQEAIHRPSRVVREVRVHFRPHGRLRGASHW